MHENEGNVFSGKGHGNFRAPIHTSAKRYMETFTQITWKGTRKFPCTFLVSVQASTDVHKYKVT